MTTNQPDRLDRIERILENLAANQAATQEQQQRTQEQLNQISADVAVMSQVLRESIPDLTAMVGSVLHSMDEHSAELRATFAADRANSAADRLAETRIRNDFRSAMLGIQNESRNILRELADLRRQQGTGS